MGVPLFATTLVKIVLGIIPKFPRSLTYRPLCLLVNADGDQTEYLDDHEGP